MGQGFANIDLTSLGLQNITGNNIRSLIPYLEFGNTFDVCVWRDDFLGDTLHGGYQVCTGGDGTAAILADQLGGVCQLINDSTTDDNAYEGLALALNFKGDFNCAMVARIKIDNITNSKIEVGFTDDINDQGAAEVLGTPDSTAEDAAIWVRDIDDGTVWQCFSVIANGTPQKDETCLDAAVNGIYETLGVALDGTLATFYHWNAEGRLTFSTVITAAITGSDPLTPWVYVESRANNQRKLDIDYIAVWQRRV